MQSLLLDRWSGKKCFMVASRALSIAFVDNPRHLEWTTHPDSRFSEVAILKCTHWLDIRGKIETQMLSPGTNYAAYLVFKLLNDTYGIKTLNAMIRIVNHENENEAAKRATKVYMPSMSRFFIKNKTDPLYEKYAKKRGNGWMEVQLGEFDNKEGDDEEVEARCMEIERLHDKSGLIVEGIEFRPPVMNLNITLVLISFCSLIVCCMYQIECESLKTSPFCCNFLCSIIAYVEYMVVFLDVTMNLYQDSNQ
ncbi:F-box protein PP2-B10-like [Lycium barbarum]|uniref:F-box protein PP2-B10-like n=1 Tax=Lycium barbarum TaxID=112863 RepID=UPI00293F1CE8|nr:F-box protein PP2-B10-like [Lycium barbarum]